MFAVHNDAQALDAALGLARGCYQHEILLGREALSGSTLRGRAKSYSGRYAASARRLLARCQAAGIPIREEIGSHGKRLLVIG